MSKDAEGFVDEVVQAMGDAVWRGMMNFLGEKEARLDERICLLSSAMSVKDFKVISGFAKRLPDLIRGDAALSEEQQALAGNVFMVGLTTVGIHCTYHELQKVKEKAGERAKTTQPDRGAEEQGRPVQAGDAVAPQAGRAPDAGPGQAEAGGEAERWDRDRPGS